MSFVECIRSSYNARDNALCGADDSIDDDFFQWPLGLIAS